MRKEQLIVFVKNPELGQVKTRLAKSIGEEAALAIYLKLLSHTYEVTSKLDCDVAIYYGKYIDSEDYWENKKFKKFKQFGNDLGERMHNAIAQSLERGYDKVCLVGSDIYELNFQIIQDAFNRLDKNDVVIGPARDGGYYLIGMKEPHRKLFQLTGWSTPHVFKETIDKIEQAGLTFDQTKMLNDIDDINDLKETDLI